MMPQRIIQYCDLIVMVVSSGSGVLESCYVGSDVEQVGRVVGMEKLLLVLGDYSDCFAGGSFLFYISKFKLYRNKYHTIQL